jgi:hypothetical protein
MTDLPDDEAIEELVRGFLGRSLPKERWTHEAHFATALWMLREHGPAGAARDMPALIRAYNESVGGVNSETAGYHETITQASLMMAAAYAGEPLHETLAALMASPLGRSDWPFAYWSKARLMSVEARARWVDPDMAALPLASRPGAAI